MAYTVLVSDSANSKYGTGVATVAVGAGGSGYTTSDVLTISTGDANATVTVLTVDGAGAVLTISRTVVGSGYTAGTKATTGGTGTNCTITITIQAGLSTVNGWYGAEAYNFTMSGAGLALSTARTIAVTFATAGNCQGIIISVNNDSNTIDRSIVVSLQERTSTGPDVWTERATKTVTANTITNTSTRKWGQWIIPIEFDTPYAVDTDVGDWKFVIQQTGGATGNWTSYTSDGTNLFYVTWCDNTATYVSGTHALCIKDSIIIDATCSPLPVLGTGATASAISVVLCRNTDPLPANVANLVWENPPNAAYTMTLDGIWVFSAHSGFRAGTSTLAIPSAQMGTLYAIKPSVGTGNTSQITGGATDLSSGSAKPGKVSFFVYGQIPATQKTTLSATANATQKVILTTATTGWASTDKVVVGKTDAGSGSGDSTVYTIDTIVTTTITFTANLASKHLSGGTVFRMNGYGFKLWGLNNLSYNYLALSIGGTSNFVLKGCECQDTSIIFGFGASAGVGAMNAYADDTANCSKFLIEDVSARMTGAAVRSWISSGGPNEYGLNVQRCYTNYANIFGTYYGSSTSVMTTATGVIHDCCALNNNYASILCNISANLDMHDCSFENGSSSGYDYPSISLQGNLCSFYNNYCYAQYYGLVVNQLYKPIKMSGNSYERCVAGIYLKNFATTGVVEKDSIFGQEYANTYDISTAAISGVPIDYEINSPTGTVTVDETGRTSMLVGSALKISDQNNLANDCRNYMRYGYIYSTGTGLTDTTVHTSGTGKYAMRFQPTNSTNLLSWDISIPTGNIQNLTMFVAVWVKINNAAYYAGTHANPTLTVDYDNGTTTTSPSGVATDSTSWQLLIVSFTPTTTYGKITVTLSGRTDAANSNSYVYWDDAMVAYPPNTSLDLGGMDLWANAMPVVPPIAIPLSAQTVSSAVWEELKSSHVTAATMGEKLGKKLWNTTKVLGAG